MKPSLVCYAEGTKESAKNKQKKKNSSPDTTVGISTQLTVTNNLKK